MNIKINFLPVGKISNLIKICSVQYSAGNPVAGIFEAQKSHVLGPFVKRIEIQVKLMTLAGAHHLCSTSTVLNST